MSSDLRPRTVAVGLLAALVLVTTAQRGFRGPRPDLTPTNGHYDGRFTLARLRYAVASGGYYYRGLPSWAHGYPDAEHNLLKITAEVSLLRPRFDSTVVVGIEDPALFRYPVSYMTEGGYWLTTDTEAATLRRYLLKGGFLILDDSRDGTYPGNMGWANIEANFARVLPGLRWVELTPAHPIFHSFFDVPSFDVVKQFYDRGRPVFRALFADNDPTKRIIVLSNFNTDVSNYWEFSATGFAPVAESNDAYKLGVNYVMYALTH